ncbi:hypothetical protein HNQ80_002739 [Anaerosolibacter carboniphilus]|uniref:Mg2+ and Co2+ transporter CorB n=1 Tax=Anaerosolibacter carboniphilus TaxID=1417629 RepID=A0A841L2Q7_9FIRM|nr:hypothetical protein [Anaerosolibacter carboniphilus]MBB6216635.1 hypothetical protein [Anaerosolibacter carboniphilus]
MKEQPGEVHHRKKEMGKSWIRLYNSKWVILITVWTFFLAMGMSFISDTILRNVNLLVAFMILVIIIFIGIFFDLIGIAVASARETPFHSMAANRIAGAKYAVKLVRNAGSVANFCNDVIGDICGIVSGAAGAILILKLNAISQINISFLSILLSGAVAAITVGGKAIAKEIALRKSKEIVFSAGKVLYFIHSKFNINILPDKRRSAKHERKRDE